MTKAGLESMIAVLKDRCKQSMSFHACGTLDTSHSGSIHYKVHTKPICSEQIISLSALIAYVAHATGRSEYRVEREFSNHFCIPNPKCLPRELYETAVSFMVEQVPTNRC